MSALEIALIFSVWGLAVVVLWVRSTDMRAFIPSRMRRMLRLRRRLALATEERVRLRKAASETLPSES